MHGIDILNLDIGRFQVSNLIGGLRKRRFTLAVEPMMATRILLVEGSKLHSASLRSRLESIGAEVILVASAAELQALPVEAFDLAVCDSRLPDLPMEDQFKALKSLACPIYLWSDDGDLLANAPQLSALGVGRSYRKLNRADLIHDAEQIIKKGQAVALGAKNFLLVEDSATVRNYVKRILSDRFPGAQITEAEDGKTALSAMKTNRIDLIVTDLQMPGMDGSSFVQMLRKNSVLAKKPVVILSGMITAQVREEMAQMTKLCFLPKPASPEALEAAVRGLLSGDPTPEAV